MTKPCANCGVPIQRRIGAVLCHDCYQEKHAGRSGRYRRKGHARERGTCMLCKRDRLVPEGKDKRWFRCDTCNRRLEGEGFLAGDAFVGRGSLYVPRNGMWRR